LNVVEPSEEILLSRVHSLSENISTTRESITNHLRYRRYGIRLTPSEVQYNRSSFARSASVGEFTFVISDEITGNVQQYIAEYLQLFQWMSELGLSSSFDYFYLINDSSTRVRWGGRVDAMKIYPLESHEQYTQFLHAVYGLDIPLWFLDSLVYNFVGGDNSKTRRIRTNDEIYAWVNRIDELNKPQFGDAWFTSFMDGHIEV